MGIAELAIALAGLGLTYYQTSSNESLQKEAIKAQARAQAVQAGRTATLTTELMIAAAVAVGLFIAFDVIKKAK